MRQTSIFLFALLLVLTVNSAALAQDTKPVEQKPATPATTDVEKPKTEVDKMIAEAQNHGEKVLGICINHDCDKESTIQGDTLERGRVLQLPQPAFPAIARAAHVQGSVDVQVLIDKDGKVIAAAAVSGHPLLQAASVKAAREAVFTPTKLDGAPVKVTGIIKYNFVTQ